MRIERSPVRPGLPGAGGLPTYRARAGDTLRSIAERLGLRLADLQVLNPGIPSVDAPLRAGQVLNLPGGGVRPAGRASVASPWAGVTYERVRPNHFQQLIGTPSPVNLRVDHPPACSVPPEFEQGLDFVLKWEDGKWWESWKQAERVDPDGTVWVKGKARRPKITWDNPEDPGTKTKLGITQKTYDAWRARHGLPKQDVSRLTFQEMIQIYSEDYWRRAHCDRLPTPLNRVIFNIAVNCGPDTAVRLLQQALQKMGHDIRADGRWGPRTQAALASVPDWQRLANQVLDELVSHYKELARKRTVATEARLADLGFKQQEGKYDDEKISERIKKKYGDVPKGSERWKELYDQEFNQEVAELKTILRKIPETLAGWLNRTADLRQMVRTCFDRNPFYKNPSM